MSEPEKQPTELRYDVPPGYREGERLDVYLTGFILNATRAKIQKGIKEGNVSVNARVVKKPSTPVHAGDVIICMVMKAPHVNIEAEAIDLDICFEDSDIIVVNKAAGMVVHPAHGHRTGTLVHALLYHVGGESITMEEDDLDPETNLSAINASPRFEGDVALRPGIVHRLDKDTSGLLVTAKNDETHTALARQFAARTTRRKYFAIVWGVPDEDSGTIDTEIARDTRDRRKMAVVAPGKGKRAVTHFRVIEKFGYTCLIEFQLETGRTHQIRVHAAHMAHPVFGDVTYGGDRIRYGKDEGQRRTFYRNLFERLPRQALHAASLGFQHPRTGEEVDYESDLPEDMSHVIDRLRTFDITR